MSDKFELKLDKIPEGSRLEKYVEKLRKIVKGNQAQILPFLKKVFVECLEFTRDNTNVSYLPAIRMRLVRTHEEFKLEEQRETKGAESKEVAKIPTHAFVVGNKFQMRMYVDLEFYVDLLRYGYPTFIMNLVQVYIHEILHLGFPQKYEQEIHDLECSLVETFMGIEMPEEIKNLKATDYYSREASEN